MTISKRTCKVITAVLIVMTILSIATSVFAKTNTIIDPGTIQPTSTNTSNSVQSIAGQILGIVQVVGVAVAVIMLIVLAIKYISAAPNDKAEIKKHAVVYVVGAVVLFGAAGLLEIIKQLAANF